MIEFLREHSRAVKISVLFGTFNVLLPIGLVWWFFRRATDVRHPILGFSQQRDETNPWLMFLMFVILLVIVSLLQIKCFRLSKYEIATYFVPCAVAFGFVVLNLLIPAWLLGWAMQDFADRGLGVFSDPPNPTNPARPIYRLVFSVFVSAMIFATETLAVRAYFARR